jgi:hypothetical protein
VHVIFSLAVDYSSIGHLLELTEGETDLESDKEIPDIFSQVSYIHVHNDSSRAHIQSRMFNHWAC